MRILACFMIAYGIASSETMTISTGVLLAIGALKKDFLECRGCDDPLGCECPPRYAKLPEARVLR